MEQTNQLLQNFSATEKVAYLSAIASIATADRSATEDEIEFLEALSDSADLSAAQEQEVIQAANDPSNANLKRHLDNLKNSELRYSLLADMISFAKLDGQYTAEEQNKVQQIASYLNINQSQFNALNQFVDKADQAHKQGQDVTSSGFMESSGLGNTLKNSGISGDFMKGALAVMAPILLSRMMSGGSRRRGMSGGMGGLGGGLLGGLLGGMASRGTMGGGMMGGGMMGGRGGMGGLGGLGSLFSVLGGSNRRYSNYGRNGGGLSSVLGGLLGGGGRSGGLF
jgi:uncharacterized tellurite resistance protein B-like protein